MERFQKKIAALLQKHNNFGLYAVLLLVVSLLPLLIAGRYNLLMADDFAMGKECHKIWEDTGSITAMLGYAFSHALEVWQTWQGCFTINFLDSLNPGFFGEGFAWITPVLMLFAMLIPLFLFVKALLKRYYECTGKDVLVIYGIMAFMMVQTMPAPVEALYWYSGAVAYTFLHFLMLLLFCILWQTERVGNKYLQAVCGVVAVIYAFFVGGCQYITVLQCVLWYCVFLFVERKELKWWKIVPGVALIAGFAVNMLAPGNATRQEGAGGLNPIVAILRSFIEAIRYGKEWMTSIVVLGIAFLVPFIWKIVKNGKRKFEYKYPVLVLMGSYCIFSAAFTPSLYGVANVVSGRIQNLIQSIFYVLMFVNLFYIIGWLQYRMADAQSGVFADIRLIKDVLKKYNWIYSWVIFAGILLVLVGTGDKNTFASISATRSLLNGEMITYYAEAQERLAIYEDDTVTIAEVEAFSVQPKVLYFADVVAEGDANYWINENIAQYYGKEKVVLRENAD